MKFALNMVSLRGGGGKRIAQNFLKFLLTESVEKFVVAIPLECGYEKIITKTKRFVPIYKDKKMSSLNRFVFDQFSLPSAIKKGKSKALFSLNNLSSFLMKMPHVLLFHHAHFVYPESSVFKKLTASELIRKKIEIRIFIETIKNCNTIIVQTPVMRERLIENFRKYLAHTDIVILPNTPFPLNGYTPTFYCRSFPAEPIWFIPTQYYPHKNLEILIEIARIFIKMGEKNIKFLITVEESDHPLAKEFLKTIKLPGISDFFINIGKQPENKMAQIYQQCLGCLFPSLVETQCFGMIEAMAFAKPIIATDFDFAKIVGENAGIYHSIFDVDMWAETIHNLSYSPSMYDDYSKKCYKQFVKISNISSKTYSQYINILRNISAR